MRAVPRLEVVEVARSGRYHGSPHRVWLSGARFVKGEPYAEGAEDVRDLAGGGRGLSLYLPGDHVWATLWLDNKGRIERERIVDAGNELDRSFHYPVP